MFSRSDFSDLSVSANSFSYNIICLDDFHVYCCFRRLFTLKYDARTSQQCNNVRYCWHVHDIYVIVTSMHTWFDVHANTRTDTSTDSPVYSSQDSPFRCPSKCPTDSAMDTTTDVWKSRTVRRTVRRQSVRLNTTYQSAVYYAVAIHWTNCVQDWLLTAS